MTSLQFEDDTFAPRGASTPITFDWLRRTSRPTALSRTPPGTLTRTSARTSRVSTSTRSQAIHGAVEVTV